MLTKLLANPIISDHESTQSDTKANKPYTSAVILFCIFVPYVQIWLKF